MLVFWFGLVRLMNIFNCDMLGVVCHGKGEVCVLLRRTAGLL